MGMEKNETPFLDGRGMGFCVMAPSWTPHIWIQGGQVKIPIEETSRRIACITSAKLDKKISATEAMVRTGQLILELIETETIKDGSGFSDEWAWATSADELRHAIRVGRLKEIKETDPQLIEEIDDYPD